jgi:hypothetical protein
MATIKSGTSRGDIKLDLGSPEVSGHASGEANRALAAAARSGAPGNLVLPCGRLDASANIKTLSSQ